MNEKVIVNFDEKLCADRPTPCKVLLKARSECIVRFPTHSTGLGFIDRAELMPANGLRPDADKIAVVRNFPKPTNTREIKQYLGLCNYYHRFIPNYSKITKPLTNLLRKNVPFVWDQGTEEAFVALKEIFTEPLLQYPDFSRPFVLTTDASNTALGAILSQGPIEQDRPIAYASRTLNNAE